jgi:hypothetical protein
MWNRIVSLEKSERMSCHEALCGYSANEEAGEEKIES